MDMIATTFAIACSFEGMETAFRGSQGASSVKRTHLDGRPTGDGGLAPPLSHGFSDNGVRAGRLTCLHYIDERAYRNSTNRPKRCRSDQRRRSRNVYGIHHCNRSAPWI